MVSNKLKKSISILTLSALLSGATFSSVSAKSNDVAKPNSTQNNIEMRIGGGPSDSASWTKGYSEYQNFNKNQLSQLNQKYNSTVMSSAYTRGQYIYNVSWFILGLSTGSIKGKVGSIVGGGTSYLATFATNYYSLIQSTANTVNQAYYKCSDNGTVALYVTQYYRPASGESILVLSWY